MFKQELLNKGLIISIEGIMRAGKTTKLKKLIAEWGIEEPQIFQLEGTTRETRQIRPVITFRDHIDLTNKIEDAIAKGHNVLFFDEFHFYPYEFLQQIPNLQRRRITLVFCLLTLYKTDPRYFFQEYVGRFADVRYKLDEARCFECDEKAYSNYILHNDSNNLVGDADKYQVLCIKHYIEKTKYK